MKLSHLAFLIFINLTTYAQIKVSRLEKTTIPRTITFKGHVVDAAKYVDKDGEHIVLTTETGVTYSADKNLGRVKNAALFAYDYNLKGDQHKLSWNLNDAIEACEFDATAQYLPHTFLFTDIDQDGVAEIWLMYKTTCTSDVSPSDMKIIMHEGKKKFAMRGRNKVKLSANEYEGGEYKFDQAFKTAPPGFRKYALALWNKNILETWK